MSVYRVGYMKNPSRDIYVFQIIGQGFGFRKFRVYRLRTRLVDACIYVNGKRRVWWVDGFIYTGDESHARHILGWLDVLRADVEELGFEFLRVLGAVEERL